MPACADINVAMQAVTDLSYTTSEQHKDMYAAIQKQNDKAMMVMLAFLQERKPFADGPDIKKNPSARL